MSKEDWLWRHNGLTIDHYLGNTPVSRETIFDDTYLDHWIFDKGGAETYEDNLDRADVAIDDIYTIYINQDRIDIIGNFMEHCKVYGNKGIINISNKQIQMPLEEVKQVLKKLKKEPGKIYQIIYKRATELIGGK